MTEDPQTCDTTHNPGSLIRAAAPLKAKNSVLLQASDADAYENHVATLMSRFQPATDDERSLVQAIADTDWRLRRIPALESGIYALGRIEFGGLFPGEDEAVRNGLIEAKVFLVYQKQLNNLSIQESRLRRQLEKDTAALTNLQDTRKQSEQKRLDELARDYIVAVHEDRQRKFIKAANGFEFSIEQIEVRAMELEPRLFADYERELYEKRERNRRNVA